MAKVSLNGITVEEINRNAQNSYAAVIDSGEIFTCEGCHSKSGKPMLRVNGRNLRLKDFNNNSFVADGCILYNPPMIKNIVALCDDSDTPLFIIGGAVSKTAPAETTTSDTVQSKEELQKEAEEIKAKYFSLTEADQKTAKARMDEIEKLLKTA